MKVSSISTNPLLQAKNVQFGASDGSSDKMLKAYALVAAAGMLATAGVSKCAHDSLEESRIRINKIFDRAEVANGLYGVRCDTVDFKDVNGDNFPELILYKPDGSRVVIDISESKKIAD